MLDFLPVSPYENLPFQDPLYKIYHDGSHYVATKLNRKVPRRRHRSLPKEVDLYFDSLYYDAAIKQKLADRKLRTYIREALLKVYPDLEKPDEYIEDRIKYKLHVLYLRIKRFKRKADLNVWTHTFTYDDNLCTEDVIAVKKGLPFVNFFTRGRPFFKVK